MEMTGHDLESGSSWTVECRHFADATGAYIGVLPIAPYDRDRVDKVPVPIFEDVPVTQKVRRPSLVNRGSYLERVSREIDEPVTVAKPVKDPDGTVVGSIDVPVTQPQQIGTRIERQVTTVTEQPQIPAGAVEVPGPPPDPAMRWDGAKWV